MPAEILPCLHDWNVYALQFFAQAELLVLHAEWYPYGSSTELLDVRFEGVCGHFFEHVLSGNIVFALHEYEPIEFIARWRDFLAESVRFNLPEGMPGTDLGELAAWIGAQRVRCFELSSSYGMHGFVIARDVRILPREQRLVPAL